MNFLDRQARSYKSALRLDRRRTPGVSGRGPDDGEDAKDYGHREDAFRYSDTSGYWKKSEYLACRRGVPMRTLDERAHFGGPTWLRARESRLKVTVLAVDSNKA